MTREEELLIELGRRALKSGAALPRSNRSETLEEGLRRERAAAGILKRAANSSASGSSASSRVSGEVGFILHSRSWSETSLLLDVLTPVHGRLFMAAKGARRGTSPMRGLLQPFQPLRLSWNGRGEVKNLTGAEWLGTLAPMNGEALLSAYYLNELVMKTTQREDVHPELFGLYVESLKELSSGSKDERQKTLRRFETRLLRILGWELTAKFSPEDRGFILIDGVLVGVSRDPYPGEAYYDKQAVAAVLREDFSKPHTMRQARDILRSALQTHLGARGMSTRAVMSDLAKFISE